MQVKAKVLMIFIFLSAFFADRNILLSQDSISLAKEYDIKEYNIANYSFWSIFGVNEQDSLETIYSFLGSGFFRTPSSKDAEQILSDWIEKNPDAKVVPVSSAISLTGEGSTKVFCYIWVVGKTDTLNIHLVEKGAYPGGTMIKPKDYSDVDRYQDLDTQGKYINHVSEEAYQKFLRSVQKAEKVAFEAKIGVWAAFREDEL